MQEPSMMFLSPGLVLPSGLNTRQACSCLQLTTTSHPSHHNAMATSTLSVCFELGITCDHVVISSFGPTVWVGVPTFSLSMWPLSLWKQKLLVSPQYASHFHPNPPFFTNHWPQTLLKEPYSPKSVSDMDPGQGYTWGGILELKEWEQWNVRS